MSETIEIRESPRALRFQAAVMLSAAVLVLLVALGRVLQGITELQTWLIALVGLGLALGGAVNLRDARARRLCLVLDAEGIRDLRRSDGAARWDELLQAELVVRRMGGAHLRLDYHLPRGGHLVMPLATLDGAVPALAEGMARFAPTVRRIGF